MEINQTINLFKVNVRHPGVFPGPDRRFNRLRLGHYFFKFIQAIEGISRGTVVRVYFF